MLYLIPLPENRLSRRGRAVGWRHMGLERDSKSKLRELVGQLKDSGAREVWASDLDQDAAKLVAEELHAIVRTDFYLRRFNWGRHHGAPLDDIERIVTELIKKWETNPDVPIRGGDSLTSLKKRLNKSLDAMMERDNVVFITDEQTARYMRERTPQSLVRNGNRIALNKIYVLRKAT